MKSNQIRMLCAPSKNKEINNLTIQYWNYSSQKTNDETSWTIYSCMNSTNEETENKLGTYTKAKLFKVIKLQQFLLQCNALQFLN